LTFNVRLLFSLKRVKNSPNREIYMSGCPIYYSSVKKYPSQEIYACSHCCHHRCPKRFLPHENFSPNIDCCYFVCTATILHDLLAIAKFLAAVNKSMIYKAPQSIRTKLHCTNILISGIYTILRIVCYIWCSALPMLRCSSFLAYTPNWPVALFLLLLHPPGTLYLLTFDCAKTFSLSNATWKPICSNSLVLLCCIKRLCIFGPKGLKALYKSVIIIIII